MVEQTRTASSTTVATTGAAGLAVEKTIAAASAAERTAAFAAKPFYLARKPVNASHDHAGGVLDRTGAILRVMAAGDGRGHHDVASPIIHRERFARNRLVEQPVGSGVENWPTDEGQGDGDRLAASNAGTHGHSLMTSGELPPGVSWFGHAIVAHAILCASDALLLISNLIAENRDAADRASLEP